MALAIEKSPAPVCEKVAVGCCSGTGTVTAKATMAEEQNAAKPAQQRKVLCDAVWEKMSVFIVVS
jgi:hypothetical protein